MSRFFRVLVPCPCCSSPCFLGLRFCLSCGWVRSLLPVLLLAGLLCSCSHRSVPVAVPVPCVVQVQELERGQFFSGEPVSGAVVGSQVWFQFQCQFPAWVGAGVAVAVCWQPEPGSELCLQQGFSEFPLLQRSGQWGFWVPVSELPSGWQRVQFQASGQVGAR